MLRTTVCALSLSRAAAPAAVRAFASTSAASNKASRSGRKIRWTAPQPASPAPASATTTPGQAGNDVGHSGGGNGLFEGDSAQPAPSEPTGPTPDQLEKEMLDGQKEAHAEEQVNGRTNYAGSDVAQGGMPDEAPTIETDKAASEKAASEEYGPEEVIYTAAPTYNPALMLSLCLVMSVFSFSLADFARTGVETYDEESGEYRNAPAWKRYLLAGGAATVGTGLVVAGVWSPTRNVVKMTVRRHARSTTLLPPDALVTLYNPLTPISQKFLRQQPRSVPLSRIHLLGQLSDGPRSYHPRAPRPAVEPKKGVLGSLLDKYFPPSKPTAASSRNARGKYGHSPILIDGDRFSMSLKTLRANEPFSSQGAWCRDWDALERALLRVDEAKWSARR